MFYKIFTIIIALMIAFLCITLNNINKIVKHYFLTPEINTTIPNFVSSEEIEIKEEKPTQTSVMVTSHLPQIWQNLPNPDVKKIIMSYKGDNLIIAEEISTMLTKDEKISIFIDPINNNTSENELANSQNALQVMDALLFLLNKNQTLEEMLQTDNYKFAITNNIPIIFLSLTPLETKNISQDIIVISQKTIYNLENEILQILKNKIQKE